MLTCIAILDSSGVVSAPINFFLSASNFLIKVIFISSFLLYKIKKTLYNKYIHEIFDIFLILLSFGDFQEYFQTVVLIMHTL